MRLALTAALLAALAAPVASQPTLPQYALDPTHTFIHVELPLSGISTTLVRFDRQQGTVNFDRAARTGQVEITIDTTSVSSGVRWLDARLRGAEVLDVERHPTARFSAGPPAFNGERLTEWRGELTLRGTTQPLALRAVRFDCYLNPLFRRQVCGGDFEAELQPAAFGISGMPLSVRLLVQVEGIPQ